MEEEHQTPRHKIGKNEIRSDSHLRSYLPFSANLLILCSIPLGRKHCQMDLWSSRTFSLIRGHTTRCTHPSLEVSSLRHEKFRGFHFNSCFALTIFEFSILLPDNLQLFPSWVLRNWGEKVYLPTQNSSLIKHQFGCNKYRSQVRHTYEQRKGNIRRGQWGLYQPLQNILPLPCLFRGLLHIPTLKLESSFER